MDDTLQTKDRSGLAVRVRDRVRVVTLADEFLQSLPEDEQSLIASMIGEILEVDEIDQWGSAWVAKYWPREDGNFDAHGVGLASTEMELISE
jgi:hypothetical protein